MTVVAASKCFYCRHLDPEGTGRMVCAAFPEEIPYEVALGMLDHDEPLPGDNGIVFEAREDLSEEELEALAEFDA